LASYSFSTKETWRNLTTFMSTIERGNRSLEERLVDGDIAHEAYH
jgi:glucose-6-phosphate isomerase